ncbi:magnesium transporter MgtE N-terminal domain-containing protein [Georgenia ruanii]|uniref:magnesium transporter MgtE N-terminal domain-containing protein n=1 Tax=Georgenia ruanii TaxID=348442 RepID=UPI0012659BA4|nr:CBS domain-containing protein [Georgenia ruanii]
MAEALVSVAGLTARPVRDTAGEVVGRIVDLVARWDGAAYPPVTGLVVRVGLRRIFVPIAQVAELARNGARLSTVRVDLRDFRRREGEVLLVRDVIDHQLVDIDGVRVIRASDLYIVRLADSYRLVGADVGMGTLLRRIGPSRWRSRPTPERVIDWGAVQPFGQPGRPLRLRRPNAGLRALRPADLADLLEELGRSQRQELLGHLDPQTAADAVEEMQPANVEQLLRESPTEQAAGLLARMEPDEAVDALRDLDADERTELLAAMPAEQARELGELLRYPEGQAGGLMTNRMVLAHPDETVAKVRQRLRENLEHREELDEVVVVDEDGKLVDTVPLFDVLLLAEPDQQMADLVAGRWPVAVAPDTPLPTLVEKFVQSRAHALVVVDADERPVGRVLADDLIDALVEALPRVRFPRVVE